MFTRWWLDHYLEYAWFRSIMHKFIKKYIHDYFKSNINQITYNLLFTNIIIYLFIFQGLFSKGEAGELVYHCTEPSHASDLMVGLNELRKSRTLCDVIICCGSREIPCHRNVLAAVSPYFRAMFTSILVLLFLKFLFQHIFRNLYVLHFRWYDRKCAKTRFYSVRRARSDAAIGWLCIYVRDLHHSSMLFLFVSLVLVAAIRFTFVIL